MGMQHNFYYETIAEDPAQRTMLALLQEPNDFQDFYHLQTDLPSGVLDLPAVCSRDTACSLLSTCTAVRLSSVFS